MNLWKHVRQNGESRQYKCQTEEWDLKFKITVPFSGELLQDDVK